MFPKTNQNKRSEVNQIAVKDRAPGKKVKHTDAKLVILDFQLQVTHVQYIDVKLLKYKRKNPSRNLEIIKAC